MKSTLIMRLIFLALAVFSLWFISGCRKDRIRIDVPACIESRIDSLKNNCCRDGATVYRYRISGEFVYVFDEGNCIADGLQLVYDDVCVQVCALGGIAGIDTCLGGKFTDLATDKTLVWKN